eukprot:269466_1
MFSLISILFSLWINQSYGQIKYVPLCSQNRTIELNNFTMGTGIGKPTYDTNVNLCYIESPLALLVRYNMLDKGVSSPYTQCNQDLYKSDAVEMFIATSFESPYHKKYIEIELNPNGALFLSLITNDCDDCSCISGDPQKCSNKHAVQFYNASVSSNKDQWTTEIQISLDWVASLTSNGHNPQQFQANFFRVDDLSSGQQLSAYNPTDKNPPCFHVPSKFISFQLS